MRYSEDLSLGHHTLDAEHQLLFGLIGDLQSAIQAARDRDAVADLVQRLFMYVFLHFATEDRLMMESDYPDARAHRVEHESAMATLRRLEAKCQAGVPSAPEETLHFMTSWASSHIPYADRKLVEHLWNQRCAGSRRV